MVSEFDESPAVPVEAGSSGCSREDAVEISAESDLSESGIVWSLSSSSWVVSPPLSGSEVSGTFSTFSVSIGREELFCSSVFSVVTVEVLDLCFFCRKALRRRLFRPLLPFDILVLDFKLETTWCLSFPDSCHLTVRLYRSLCRLKVQSAVVQYTALKTAATSSGRILSLVSCDVNMPFVHTFFISVTYRLQYVIGWGTLQ